MISSVTAMERTSSTSSDNYEITLGSLNGLVRTLRQSPGLFHQYNAFIQDQVSKGMVEAIVESNKKVKNKYTTYLTMQSSEERTRSSLSSGRSMMLLLRPVDQA